MVEIGIYIFKAMAIIQWHPDMNDDGDDNYIQIFIHPKIWTMNIPVDNIVII